MSFPPAFLDELRARVGLVQVISRRVKLTKAGREWKGCCPFHNEKTPSFYVNEDKGFYHCFGCGVHGDVIRFVTEQEGLRFPEAVRSLAAEAGIDVPEERPEDRERAKAQAGLHEIMAEAADWYAQQLGGLQGAAARAYIDKRGLSAATVKAFGMGYAPDGNRLKAALAVHGEALLAEAGLTGHAEERDDSYDRFRNRLMFPIRDPRGRVAGFGGRVLGDGQPKYLNSPDTPLFDKGRMLYNLDKAGPLARKSGRLIVVEGYMDVIGLAEAGIGEAVAPLGTAVTEMQLQLMWRYEREPILCFDGDSAGQRAALRAAMRALPLLEPGHSLRFATLPPGQDPDDLVRNGGRAAFEAVLERAEPLHVFLWRTSLESGETSTPERIAEFRQNLRDIADLIQNVDIRALYQNEFRERFNAAFGWKATDRMTNVVPLNARQAAKPRAKAIAREMRAIIVGWLRFPEAVAADIEIAAALPLWVTLVAYEKLRQGILDAVAWNPSIDSAELRHTLSARGLIDLYLQAERNSGQDWEYTFADTDSQRAIKLLRKHASALVELHDTGMDLQAATAELKAAQREGRDAHDVFERQANLARRSIEIYRELGDWAAEFGRPLQSRLRIRTGEPAVDDIDTNTQMFSEQPRRVA